MKAESQAYRTSDSMEWDTAMALVRRLFRDGDYRMSLLVGSGCFFGLRISDLLSLTWNMLLDDDRFIVHEKKTGKRRVVRINKEFQQHIKKCYNVLNVEDSNQYCFLSQKKVVYSTQRVNILLKEIKRKYSIKIDHFSTHSLRKTFGRKVFESAGENASIALMKLSELFNHSNPAITRRYLGITEKELLETYDLLDF